MKIFVIILQIVIFSGLEAAWIDRKAEGWAWYEDKVEQEIEIDPLQRPAQEQLREAKMQLEEKLAEALINPTEQNLRNYMEEQKKWLQQSASFAQMWGKVLLMHPELDPTATDYPVTQYGIQLKKEIDDENRRQFIGELAKANGLFFFYEGNSKISQALAKVIKKFSEKYSWDVVAISVDGIFLDEFSTRKIDNGITKQIDIAVYPALFVMNPKNLTATPVAYGFASLDQIEDKIILQFKTEREDENG